MYGFRELVRKAIGIDSMKKATLRALASAAIIFGVFAISAPSMALQAVRTQNTIQLDGKLDEADWQRAPVQDKWVENMPNEKAAPRVKNEVRVLYDQNAIYFGIKAFDPDVSKIDGPFVRRDKVFGTADNLIVWIDPTGARKFAQFFRINPRGILGDGSWTEDTTNEDFAPDYDYEGAAFVGTDYWSAELRIPWTSLRIPHPVPEKLTFIVFRNMPRETRIRMSTAVLGRDPNCFLCVAEELTGITDIPKTSGITISPYVSGNFTQQKIGSTKTSESKFNAGADLKWRPTSEWVIDATLRPDFSQLELDQPQLRSNTRFALFVPEKRPFFLEGNDLYSLPDTSVYTRSITDPLWGTRATYRSASLDATAITVADRGGGFTVLPNTYFSDFKEQGKSQATFARVRMPYSLAGNGSVGALLSDRTYENGDSNRVVSLDATHKPSDATRFRAQLIGSETEDSGARSRGHYLYFDTSRDDGPHRMGAYYFEVSPKFRFDNGLLGQNGFRGLGGDYRYCINRKDVFFDNVCPNIAFRESRTWDNVPLQRWVTPALFANGAKNSEWNLQPRFINYRRVQEGGKWHHTPTLFFFANGNPGRTLTYTFIETEVGRSIDVATDTLTKLALLSTGFNLRPIERIELETSFTDYRLFDNDSNRWRLVEKNASILGIGHITARDTMRLIAQYTLSKRNPLAYTFAVTPRTQTQALSVVYAHKRGLGREFNLGATRSNVNSIGEARQTTSEVFAKLSWAVSL
jgi:Domain of unknown function (DUF5916)